MLPVQPSASARCTDGTLEYLDAAPIEAALDHALIPLVYGDVALDGVRGGTIISTETIFFYLAEKLCPDRIFLLGEVAGVYDSDRNVVALITPANLSSVAASLGGSHGTDVTGGMASKVRTMVELTKRVAGLQIRIFGGSQPGQIEQALLASRSAHSFVRPRPWQ